VAIMLKLHRIGDIGFIGWLGLRLATNSGPTLGVPIC
jgi:hypothetical protein